MLLQAASSIAVAACPAMCKTSPMTYDHWWIAERLERPMLTGTIQEIAEQAGRILSVVAAGAYCVPQEWDRRIDCLIELPNGDVVGEMISLDEATETRIRKAGERLRQRLLGLNVELHDELKPPIRISRLSD